jgi:hypothetical protein
VYYITSTPIHEAVAMNNVKALFTPDRAAYPAATPTTPATATPARRYRERDFGVGYGSSSGYAAERRYASDRGAALLRCR